MKYEDRSTICGSQFNLFEKRLRLTTRMKSIGGMETTARMETAVIMEITLRMDMEAQMTRNLAGKYKNIIHTCTHTYTLKLEP